MEKRFLAQAGYVQQKPKGKIWVYRTLVFQQHNDLTIYLEGNVVDAIHKQEILQSVDGYRNVVRQINAFQCSVQFSKQIGVAEKQGENAVFVLGVRGHTVKYCTVTAFFQCYTVRQAKLPKPPILYVDVQFLPPQNCTFYTDVLR